MPLNLPNFLKPIAKGFTKEELESAVVSLTISEKKEDTVSTIHTLKEIEDFILTNDNPPKVNHENLQKFLAKYKENISFSEYKSAITLHFHIPLSTNSVRPENSAKRSNFVDYLKDDVRENVFKKLHEVLTEKEPYQVRVHQSKGEVRIVFTKELATLVIDKKDVEAKKLLAKDIPDDDDIEEGALVRHHREEQLEATLDAAEDKKKLERLDSKSELTSSQNITDNSMIV